MNLIEKGVDLIQHPTQKMVLISILLISGVSFMAIAVWRSSEITFKLKDVEITFKK